METIAAIATPHAAGGISVIRISGDQAFAVADRIFHSDFGKIPSKMAGYTCAYGTLANLDDGILTAFRAPHSYTGEDVVELSWRNLSHTADFRRCSARRCSSGTAGRIYETGIL